MTTHPILRASSALAITFLTGFLLWGCGGASKLAAPVPASDARAAGATAMLEVTDEKVPQEVTITQHSVLNGSSTFSATGAIEDSGPVTLDRLNATAIPSPVVGTAHYIRTYHGAAGALTIQLQTLLTATDVPWLFAERGHWVLLSGTGAYEGLHGAGEEEGIRDFSTQTLDLTLTGEIHGWTLPAGLAAGVTPPADR